MAAWARFWAFQAFSGVFEWLKPDLQPFFLKGRVVILQEMICKTFLFFCGQEQQCEVARQPAETTEGHCTKKKSQTLKTLSKARNGHM